MAPPVNDIKDGAKLDEEIETNIIGGEVEDQDALKVDEVEEVNIIGVGDEDLEVTDNLNNQEISQDAVM